MAIIDVQVHAYEANHPGRPWLEHLAGPPHVTGDEMVTAMAEVKVDGAILVSPFTTYGYDASYALEVHAKHPGKFGLVKPVDTNDPAIAEIVADWAATKGAVGIRIVVRRAATKDPADPGLNNTLAAAAKHGLPVNLFVLSRHEQSASLIARNPNTVCVIDHLGLRQPPLELRGPPWAELPKVLDMAKYENARMKVSGACTLSLEPYPYNDIWDPVMKVIDAYGLDRCMWGTDWTRATDYLTFVQGVDPFRESTRLSKSDKAALMGGTVEKVYGWSPS
jgi:predicted TIM-barrel fold metal-dependent hydrolase